MTEKPAPFVPPITQPPVTQPPATQPPVAVRRRRFWRRGLALLAIAGLLIPIAGFVAIVRPGPLAAETTVVILHGMGVRDIAAALQTAGAIDFTLPFRAAAAAIAYNALKPGEYRLPARASMADIVLQMHEGRAVIRWFTVAEGLTSAEIVKLVDNDPILTGAVDAVPPEGALLPQTYRYSYGDSRASLVTRMAKGMTETLAEVWAARDPAVALKTPEQAVVLASIVEKETGKPAERPRIAGVFYNRLRASMRLQSDPTVIYALTGGRGLLGRELTHDDLANPSPVNTYASDGLPPQPICNPGHAALQAALHPEANDYLYFVADGTGGHVFSRNLAEHNANVAKWSQLRRRPGMKPAVPGPVSGMAPAVPALVTEPLPVSAPAAPASPPSATSPP